MDTQNLSDYYSQAQQYNSFLENEENRKQTYEFMKEQAGMDLGMAVPQFFDGVNNFVEKAQKIASGVEKLKGQFTSLPDRMQTIYNNTKSSIQRTAGRVQDIANDTMDKGKQFIFKTREQAQNYLDQETEKYGKLYESTKNNLIQPIRDAEQLNKQKFQEMRDRLSRPLTEEEAKPFMDETDRIKGLKQEASDKWDTHRKALQDQFEDKKTQIEDYAKGLKDDAEEQIQRRAQLNPEQLREVPRSIRDRITDFEEADPEEHFSRYNNENRAREPVQAEPQQPEEPRAEVSEEQNVRPSQVERQAPQFETPEQQLPQIQQQAQQQAQEVGERAQELGQRAEQIVTERTNEAVEGAQQMAQTTREAVQDTARIGSQAVEDTSQAVKTSLQEGSNIAKGAVSEGVNIAKQGASEATEAITAGATEAAGSALEVVPVIGEVIGTLALIGEGIADLVHHPTAPPPAPTPEFVSGI
jgi:hypothetical protein